MFRGSKIIDVDAQMEGLRLKIDARMAEHREMTSLLERVAEFKTTTSTESTYRALWALQGDVRDFLSRINPTPRALDQSQSAPPPAAAEAPSAAADSSSKEN